MQLNEGTFLAGVSYTDASDSPKRFRMPPTLDYGHGYNMSPNVQIDNSAFESFNAEFSPAPQQQYNLPKQAVGLTASTKLRQNSHMISQKKKKLKMMDFSSIAHQNARKVAGNNSSVKAMNRTMDQKKQSIRQLSNVMKTNPQSFASTAQKDLIWPQSTHTQETLDQTRSRPFDVYKHSQSVSIEPQINMQKQGFPQFGSSTLKPSQDNNGVYVVQSTDDVTGNHQLNSIQSFDKGGLPRDDSLFTTPNQLHDTSINSVYLNQMRSSQHQQVESEHAKLPFIINRESTITNPNSQHNNDQIRQIQLKGAQEHQSRQVNQHLMSGQTQRHPNQGPMFSPRENIRAQLQTRDPQSSIERESIVPHSTKQRFNSLASQQQLRRRTKFKPDNGASTPSQHPDLFSNSMVLSNSGKGIPKGQDVPFVDSLQTQVVTQQKFDKMARERANDGSLIEKTIFILKPLLVPYSIPPEGPKKQKLKFKKKQQKLKSNQQRAIYKEALPNHMAAPFTQMPRSMVGRRSSLGSDAQSPRLTNSMKNILVSGDQKNPDFVLVNKEESYKQRLGQARRNDDVSACATNTDAGMEEQNTELLEQLQELMVNSHVVDKIFNKKLIQQLFPQGKLPEVCQHGEQIKKEEIISKLQIVMTENQDKQFFDAAQRDLKYYGRQKVGESIKKKRFPGNSSVSPSRFSQGQQTQTPRVRINGTPDTSLTRKAESKLRAGSINQRNIPNSVRHNARFRENSSARSDRSGAGITQERNKALNLILQNKQTFNSSIDSVGSKTRSQISGRNCSVSPSVLDHTTDDGSIQVVSGHALHESTKHAPYKYWRDRELAMTQKKLEFVPKNYYKNYRTNMVRDAHDIVTELMAGKLRNSSADANCFKCEEAKLMECDCIEHKKKQELGIDNSDVSPPPKKKKKKTFYEHHKPYQPCRRGCSVHHSPFWHAERMRQEHLARANQGHTKVMLMRVIEGPQKSATEQKNDNQEKLMHEIDLNESDIYRKMTLKRLQTLDRKTKKRGSPQKSPKLSPRGSPEKTRFDSLDSAEFRDKEEQELAELERQQALIFSMQEMAYLQNILKNPAVFESEQINLDEIYKKAKKTLKQQMHTLLLSKEYAYIVKQYRISEGLEKTKEVKCENLIKLLVRNIKMQSSRDDIQKILKLCEKRIESEKKLQTTIAGPLPHAETVAKMYFDLVQLTGRIYKSIDALKDTEKTLDRPFMFRKKRWDDNLHYELKDLRTQLMEQLNDLKNNQNMKYVLLANGEVGDMRELTRPQKMEEADRIKETLASKSPERPMRKITIKQ